MTGRDRREAEFTHRLNRLRDDAFRRPGKMQTAKDGVKRNTGNFTGASLSELTTPACKQAVNTTRPLSATFTPTQRLSMIQGPSSQPLSVSTVLFCDLASVFADLSSQ